MHVATVLAVLGFVVAADAMPPGQIAYVTRDDYVSGFQIHVINPDGSGRRALARGQSPSWSPDGERIVFDGVDGISMMDRDGANMTLLLEAEGVSYPSFSHDGSQIVFMQSEPATVSSPMESFIYIMDAVLGAEPRRIDLFASNPEDPTILQSPVVSPDGRTLAFTFARPSQYGKRDGAHLYLADLDGSRLRVIGTDGMHGYPRWSADGSKLAFYGRRAEGEGIYTADADGSNQILLSPDWNIDWSPTWSPDGEWIAFSSSQSRKGIDLFIMRADGSHVTNLTHTDKFPDSDPAWSPVALPSLPTTVEPATWGQIKSLD